MKSPKSKPIAMIARFCKMGFNSNMILNFAFDSTAFATATAIENKTKETTSSKATICKTESTKSPFALV